MASGMKYRLSFKHALLFALVLTVCFSSQYAVLMYLERRLASLRHENNNYNIIGRLQTVHKRTGDVIIVGSSLTGQMKSGNGIVCVSVAGSSFLAGLPFIPPALINSNAVVVLEANTFFTGFNREILDVTEKLSFKIGQRW